MIGASKIKLCLTTLTYSHYRIDHIEKFIECETEYIINRISIGLSID